MRADLLLVAAAEPTAERVLDPGTLQRARFTDAEDRTRFHRTAMEGPPRARFGHKTLDLGHMAWRFAHSKAPRPDAPLPPTNGQPAASSRPQIANTVRRLGGIYLAEYLSRHGLQVDLINHLDEDRSRAEAAWQREPRAVGISSTFLPDRESVERLARIAKAQRPDLPILVGGALASMSHRVATNPQWQPYHRELETGWFFVGAPDPQSPIDYFVVDRRGEQTLARLLLALRDGKDPSRIPNLAIKQPDGTYRFTETAPEVYDPHQHEVRWSDVPDHHLGREVSVSASSGCPFTCAFCNFHAFESGAGKKTMDMLVPELRHLRQRGMVRRVYYTDDILFVSRRHMREFCGRIRSEGLADLAWGGYARIDLIDVDDAQMLADSGCRFLSLGIESGAPTVQKAMQKHLKIERIPRIIEALNRAGISTHSSFLLGFPGETAETVGETIDLLNAYPKDSAALNYYAAFVFSLIPFGPVDEMRARFGLEGMHYDWRHRTMDVAEAMRQYRRLALGVEHVLAPYPGDHAGMHHYLGADGSARRVHEVLALRSRLARAQEDRNVEQEERLLRDLESTVRSIVLEGSEGRPVAS